MFLFWLRIVGRESALDCRPRFWFSVSSDNAISPSPGHKPATTSWQQRVWVGTQMKPFLGSNLKFRLGSNTLSNFMLEGGPGSLEFAVAAVSVQKPCRDLRLLCSSWLFRCWCHIRAPGSRCHILCKRYISRSRPGWLAAELISNRVPGTALMRAYGTAISFTTKKGSR